LGEAPHHPIVEICMGNGGPRLLSRQA
jgi:hypothetical protein